MERVFCANRPFEVPLIAPFSAKKDGSFDLAQPPSFFAENVLTHASTARARLFSKYDLSFKRSAVDKKASSFLIQRIFIKYGLCLKI